MIHKPRFFQFSLSVSLILQLLVSCSKEVIHYGSDDGCPRVRNLITDFEYPREVQLISRTVSDSVSYFTFHLRPNGAKTVTVPNGNSTAREKENYEKLSRAYKNPTTWVDNKSGYCEVSIMPYARKLCVLALYPDGRKIDLSTETTLNFISLREMFTSGLQHGRTRVVKHLVRLEEDDLKWWATDVLDRMILRTPGVDKGVALTFEITLEDGTVLRQKLN